jgi:pilus assembly protein Flp/PilA
MAVHHRFLQILQSLRFFIKQESGQDLVEYALVIALIALAATVGMKSLAGGINKTFDSVSVSLATDI